MKEMNRENIEKRLLEASLLPGADPRRQEVEREVRESGGSLVGLWERTLRENALLREELRCLDPPEGFAGRLMRIPAAMSSGRLLEHFRLPYWMVSAAAVLMIGAFLGWTALRPAAGERASPLSLGKVASLALDRHVHEQEYSVITLSPEYFETSLASSVPFTVVLPAVDSDYRLVGGRSMSLDNHPAVCSRWTGRHGECSLFQFRSSDFGIPEHTDREVIHSDHVNCPAAAGRNCEVVVWSENGRGYALVSDSLGAMDCIPSGK